MNIEYQMTMRMYNHILSTRKTDQDKKMNPKEYVMNVLNNENRLKGTVTKIFIFDS